jgi:serine/threonine-protein kinase
MRRSARVASLVAAAHHASVVGIQGFRQRDGIRLLFMDLIDGYDLRVLLSPKVYDHVRRNSTRREWAPVRKVVVTHGPERARLLPGTAVAIIRDCLLGLSVLHRLGIVHGDIKPANIMLSRGVGRAAIVDLGSAFELSQPPNAIIQTPAYAAPEAVCDGTRTPKSDLVSLGYVFVECLAGQRLFRRDMSSTELQEAKRTLPQRLRSLLPEKVVGSWRLLRFCEKLTAFDPQDRFDSADDADLNQEWGASAFLQELAQVGLSAVYDSDIRLWLDAVACRN